MKKPLCLVASLTLCLLLAGCGSMDDVLGFGHPDDDVIDTAPPAAIASVAAPAENPMTGFCRSVASQDATGNGFDTATQRRVYIQSYTQCAALYAR
jgi:hypothetical protein